MWLPYWRIKRNNNAKCDFYRAANAVFEKVGRIASEEVILQLVKSRCLSEYQFYCMA